MYLPHPVPLTAAQRGGSSVCRPAAQVASHHFDSQELSQCCHKLSLGTTWWSFLTVLLLHRYNSKMWLFRPALASSSSWDSRNNLVVQWSNAFEGSEKTGTWCLEDLEALLFVILPNTFIRPQNKFLISDFGNTINVGVFPQHETQTRCLCFNLTLVLVGTCPQTRKPPSQQHLFYDLHSFYVVWYHSPLHVQWKNYSNKYKKSLSRNHRFHFVMSALFFCFSCSGLFVVGRRALNLSSRHPVWLTFIPINTNKISPLVWPILEIHYTRLF